MLNGYKWTNTTPSTVYPRVNLRLTSMAADSRNRQSFLGKKKEYSVPGKQPFCSDFNEVTTNACGIKLLLHKGKSKSVARTV